MDGAMQVAAENSGQDESSERLPPPPPRAHGPPTNVCQLDPAFGLGESHRKQTMSCYLGLPLPPRSPLEFRKQDFRAFF